MIPDKIPQKVYTKQIDLLYQQVPFSLVTVGLIAPLVFFSIHNFQDITALQIWLILVTSTIMFRAFSVYLYHKTKEKNSAL